MRILLVEDDEVLQDILLKALTQQHYVVDTAANGQFGWEYAESTHYDLIVLDVELPKLDGITLCQRLRAAHYTTPILLITAKDGSSDRVRGLDAGADDYLIKPLDLAELQARIRALLRRGEVATANVLQVGELRLDLISCQANYREIPLSLTPKEYSLLEIFLRNPSRVFSRGQLVEHLWTFDDPPQEDSVKAHIKGLRQKLKQAGAVDWIENVYGLGYRLREGVGEATHSTSTAASEAVESHGEARSPAVATAIPDAATQPMEQRFDQERDQLWQQYSGLMAERLQILQTAAIAIANHALSDELCQEARRAAHKLAGVLGMFGRDAGSELARQLEDSLIAGDALRSPDHSLTVPAQMFMALVQALETQLALSVSTEPVVDTARLLLIDVDQVLGRELQALGQPLGLNWQQVETLEAAKNWLQSHVPDAVVLSIDVAQRERCLAMVTELNARSPSVPVLVLASADGLLNRVTVARAGGQMFLVKPVTANAVWDATTRLLQQPQSRLVKVLVVDDDPIFLAGVRSILEPWGLRVIGLDAPLRFWDVLRSTLPDLLILDVDMPEISGVELCQAVRTDPEWQHLPILFLTRHSDRDTIQQVFSAGADDYATKPVVGAELIARITNRLERSRLLQTLSTQDPLTGLSNQPQSSRDLEHALHVAEQTAQPFCLIVIALTQIHHINLNYGHRTGNQLLQQLSGLLRAALPASDVLSYWGNGEFVGGIAGLTAAQAAQYCSAFLAKLQQQQFIAPDGKPIDAIAHCGIAEYPKHGKALQALYQCAVHSLK